MKPIRLTETVKKGGCAAKLPAGTLKQVLAMLNPIPRSELRLGAETLDDAALWDLGDGRLMVQTLDFFTPMVDDPFDFGAIAAANALSDVYAMGGEPATALTILAFPTQILDETILLALMRGAVAKIQEAGACLAGGHSIDDDTLKLGFAVSGFVEASQAWKNSGAKIGNQIILTKALGTGTLCSAIKASRAEPQWIAGAVASMKQLNRVPSLLPPDWITAATDITGFGLAAHCLQVARASKVSLKINLSQLPVLSGAMACLENGILNRAHRTNAEYVGNAVQFATSVSEPLKQLVFDAQTSGGLLLFVAPELANEVVHRLENGFSETRIIGEAVAMEAGQSQVVFS